MTAAIAFSVALMLSLDLDSGSAMTAESLGTASVQHKKIKVNIINEYLKELMHSDWSQTGHLGVYLHVI